jgi:hypothetical protein
MIRAVWSYIVSLRATSRFGDAVKLRDAGRKTEAMVAGKEALAILRRSAINRAGGPEGSCLACCTVLVEELSTELHETGADIADIKDTLTFLRRLPLDPQSKWIPYLESRAGNAGASTV